MSHLRNPKALSAPAPTNVHPPLRAALWNSWRRLWYRCAPARDETYLPASLSGRFHNVAPGAGDLKRAIRTKPVRRSHTMLKVLGVLIKLSYRGHVIGLMSWYDRRVETPHPE